MTVTNNYGKIVTCCKCKDENLKDYKVFTPAFAMAIDSVYIGWCEKHEQEGIEAYNKATGEVDSINKANSNS